MRWFRNYPGGVCRAEKEGLVKQRRHGNYNFYSVLFINKEVLAQLVSV